MGIVDLGHPAFACRDLEATLAFYAKLGVHESFRLLHDDGTLMLIYLHIGGDRFIEVFPHGPEEHPASQSFMHICLAVEGIEEFAEDIRGKGIAIDIEPKMGLDFNTQAWITDPDGNKIELMEYSPNSPQIAIRDGSAFPSSEILIKAD
ncbi:MAG: VOC family protein [Thermomicrobiales bacterium]|nr:VOC family protein [Thermomicrobiales bacterium]